jgi:hypothetical protein
MLIRVLRHVADSFLNLFLVLHDQAQFRIEKILTKRQRW